MAKDKGYTIIVRDADGKELERMENVDQYMLIWEGDKRMDVKAKCIMQWAAYALKVADANLSNSLQREEMRRVAGQPGIGIAQDVPPTGMAGSRKSLHLP